MKRIQKAGPGPGKCVHAYTPRMVILIMAFVLPLLLPGTAAAQTGAISGTVTDAVTGAGLASSVAVYSWNGQFITNIGTTAGTGAYTLTALPAGIYFVRTFAASNYVDKAWVNLPCESCSITTTEPITVNAGATTPNINFALGGRGTVAGSVVDAGTAAAIGSVSLGIYQVTPAGFVNMANPFTNSGGAYTVTGLPAGTYVARTFLSSLSPYMDEGYDNVSCAPSCGFNTLTTFTVNEGATTSAINFTLAQGGGISGTVAHAVTAAGLANVTVAIYNSTGAQVRSVNTVASGAYTAVGLPAGTYYARTFVGSSVNNLDEAYNDIACQPTCTVTSTTPITVAGTATTPNINFALSPGGGIAGIVTDEGATPLPNVSVQVYSSTGTPLRSGFSDATGAYLVVGLLPGTYYARTFASSTVNNVDEAYNNAPCMPSCNIISTTPITVLGTATTGAINFALSAGGGITGTATDARTGAPGPFISVTIFSSTGASVRSGSTNSSGVYSVLGLPAGTYYARTSASTTYVSELYNNIDCPHNACVVTNGAPITVTTGGTQGGINFPLLPTGAADIVVNFGSPGLWMLSADDTWRQLHGLSPVATVTGDFDGNGRDDLVVNFGPGIGVWFLMNHASWVFLHALSPTQIVAADLDNNGRDEAVLAFAGAGIWRWSEGNWFFVHATTPNRMAVGRIDAAAGDDLVVDFPGAGIWLLGNGAWSPLHPLNSVDMLTADLNGSGRDEILVTFAGFGLWAYRDGATWSSIHALAPARVAAGHLDTGTREDLVIDFGSAGVWTYRNDATWGQLHALSTQGIVVVDRTVSLSDEIILDFGPGVGLWQFSSSNVWSPLHGLSPEALSFGRLR